MTIRDNPEHREQCAVIQWCEIYQNKYPDLNMIFAIQNTGGLSGGFKKNIGKVMYLKAEGTKSGIPDLCLPVPAVCIKKSRTFHGLFIEMKSANGTLSKSQKEWITKLTNLSYSCKVAYSGTEAINFICDYLNIDAKIL